MFTKKAWVSKNQSTAASKAAIDCHYKESNSVYFSPMNTGITSLNAQTRADLQGLDHWRWSPAQIQDLVRRTPSLHKVNLLVHGRDAALAELLALGLLLVDTLVHDLGVLVL